MRGSELRASPLSMSIPLFLTFTSLRHPENFWVKYWPMRRLHRVASANQRPGYWDNSVGGKHWWQFSDGARASHTNIRDKGSLGWHRNERLSTNERALPGRICQSAAGSWDKPNERLAWRLEKPEPGRDRLRLSLMSDKRVMSQDWNNYQVSRLRKCSFYIVRRRQAILAQLEH